MLRPTPAIVSQSAVRALPRWAVALVCVFFLLPGFLGRDPWRSHELESFAVMLDMAWHGSSWWDPSVLGQAAKHWGLLPYWLGASSMVVLSGFDAAWAAKLPFMALAGLSLWATWHSAFLLAIQPAAQPVSFAFGGEANPKDYARAIADGALLLLVACLGLALLAHETTVDSAKLSFVSLWLLAWLRWELKGHNRSTFSLWLVSSLGLSLSGAPLLAAVLALGASISVWLRHQHQQPIVWALCLAYTLPSLLVLWVVWQLGWTWPSWSFATSLQTNNWLDFLELLSWFTWPAGILGLWALWKWRLHLNTTHIFAPGFVVVVLLVATLFQGAADRTLLLALPALAVLAAFALPTLKRSVIALVDWFAVLFFSFGAVFIWVMWLAMMTGFPAKPAANVARLAPSFEPIFYWWLFVPALAASVGWIILIVWRLSRAQVALWKPVALSASGALLCWLLLMTLWLPLLNHGMGLGPVAKRIAQITEQQSCIGLHDLQDTYVAALQYHGQVRVWRVNQAQSGTCRWLAISPSSYEMPTPYIQWQDWDFVQTIPRLRESRDGVLLLQRKVNNVSK